MFLRRLYPWKQYIRRFNLNFPIKKTYYSFFWYQFLSPTSKKKASMSYSWISENYYRKQQNMQKLQIFEALHMRNIQPNLNGIKFKSTANIRTFLSLLTRFIETSFKNKRNTIHRYKRSFLQSCNIHAKVTSLLQYTPHWWWPNLGQKVPWK